ncbi:Metallo-dependent phosphatase [Sporormia fimetaria CBS 119925]|uniref:Metallo-dependent phosphatase n=1 Tax=Sporormia fimetaria CBS 119925 TaxID=1340428 RepID=A0A6A6V940_9PLEO|nr:Metallo-dependent phosphatase [Sporormia fimetaria CBS 119925]
MCSNIPLRKTRIVCIADTHNNTPKLPKGDVLIHAGDLTNQGSYSELKKTVEWLEKADFEAKIVIAGNHDITLDAAFYEEHKANWKWPAPQHPAACKSLFRDSTSITYLENEAAMVYLESPAGPQTCFKVYGSPNTPRYAAWAFQYAPDEAPKIWEAIPPDADIVVTHTPPRGYGDAERKGERAGCKALLQALNRVRPMLAVSGHIHEGRGVKRVQWNNDASQKASVRQAEAWTDPGLGNNKLSLVNLTRKEGRPLDNSAALTRWERKLSLASDAPTSKLRAQHCEAAGSLEANITISTSQGVCNGPEDTTHGGAIPRNHAAIRSAIGTPAIPNDAKSISRRETVMINAAFLRPWLAGRPMQVNKPIVVDIELPVWNLAEEG